MHPVKVFDNSGNLKKIITVKSLQKRSDQIIETPSIIRKAAVLQKESKEKIMHDIDKPITLEDLTNPDKD